MSSESLRRSFWTLMLTVAAIGVAACGPNQEMVPVNASEYQGDLETLSRARIFSDINQSVAICFKA